MPTLGGSKLSLLREEKGEPPIETWEEMKEDM
jgi:hypothetical protein